jgi:hypothetical protein
MIDASADLALSERAVYQSAYSLTIAILCVGIGRPLRAHDRHSVRSRGFSKPDVRSKTPMTVWYRLRWFETEPTDDGNADMAAREAGDADGRKASLPRLPSGTTACRAVAAIPIVSAEYASPPKADVKRLLRGSRDA